MPILVENIPFQPRGLVLAERALIGRRPFNTIMVADPTVSRIHAWVGKRNGNYVLFDAGSRLGTFVDGHRVTIPVQLSDGNKIKIGPSTLTFHDADTLPQDVTSIDPAPMPPASDPYDGGIYFDCTCGGPMWVTSEFAGATGKCRYCGQRIVVPHMSGAMARPIAPVVEAAAPVPAKRRAATAPPEIATTLCSICQTAIYPTEPKTACPSCNLSFHKQCWEENYGCSAYGCDQVNVLAPREEPAATATEDEPAAFVADILPAKVFPWDSVVLALSFVALGLGALTFGAPSAIMLLVALVAMFKRKFRRKGLGVFALLVCVIGSLAGFGMSMFWWKGVRVWEMFIK